MVDPKKILATVIFFALCVQVLSFQTEDESEAEDEPEGCPRDRDEAVARGQQCLRKCKSDEDCISSRKRCLCDGLCGWSCVRPDLSCEGLASPKNGAVRVTGEHFGAVATYTCDEGFWLSGSKERTCQGDANWTGSPSECREKGNTMCGSPPHVPYTRHSAPLDKEQFETDALVQYSCYPGYDPKGFARAKCLSWNGTAQWFGPDLKCLPRSCGPPGDIDFGRREGSTFTFTSRVSYFCVEGFELLGKAHRYCQSNGQWSGTLPTCRPVQCEIPVNPQNGRSLYTSLSFNSVVKYECRYGYKLVGSNTRNCGTTKKWEGDDPLCEEIDCGSPGPFYNGFLEGHSSTMGSVLFFRCYDGMKLEGPFLSTTCLQDGNWSNPMPKCLAPCIVPDVSCGNVTDYTTGTLVPHGHNITVVCDKHYELAYNATPTTCSNGTWTHVPTCVPARCRQLPKKPRNGMVIAPKTEHGTKALYKCKDGFDLHGPNVTECHFGQWSGSTPLCKENYCPFPGVLKNGRVLLVGYMGMYDYRPYVRKVTNNRQIMYECRRHYTLIEGPPGATCVDGQWSPKLLPKCVKESHPQLASENQNQKRRRRRNAWNHAHTRMRRKMGVRRRRKKFPRNKERIGKEPCDPFPEPEWMQVEIVRLGKGNDSLPHGTVVNVTCMTGYKLNIGNRTAKCVKGKWKPKEPQCDTLPCQVPSTPNGVYHHFQNTVPADDNVSHGEILTLSCSSGYQLMGSDSLRCWYGNWAVDNLPECVARPCELPEIEQGFYLGGYRSGLTISHGSSIDYDCQPEYLKTTDDPIRCSEGDFKPQLPSCMHHTLKSSMIVESPDGVQETDVRFRKPEGFVENLVVELSSGVGWRSCGPPERQQNTLMYPTGKIQTQSDEPQSGGNKTSERTRLFPHNTEVKFNCISGLTGEKTTWKIVCEDGNWVGGAYKCDADTDIQQPEDRTNKSCVFQNNEPNLVAFLGDALIEDDVSEHPPQTELVFRCKDIGKFSLIGSIRRKCELGDWDGVKPTCFGLSQENDYALEKPPTILFRHQLGPIAQSTDGKLIVYPGTILHLECLWIRKYGIPHWQISHSYRKYPEGWTNEPGRDPQLEYRLSIYHAQKDDSGRFTCVTPMGHQHSVDIVVSAVHCQLIRPTLGLQISTNKTHMETKVVFTCREGQTLIGSDEATCFPSGNWSSDIPSCQVTECPDLSNATSTSDNLKSEISGRTVGSRASFACPTGYGLRGTDLLLCLASGKWSAAVPRCEEVKCEAPGVPLNGYLQGDKEDVYRGGEIIQYACNSNHMMDGAAIIVCQESGRWSAPVPKCVQACQYPGTTPGATISNVQFFYRINETVTFDCADGFELRGAKMLVCLPDGRWSSTTPTCHSLRKG